MQIKKLSFILKFKGEILYLFSLYFGNFVSVISGFVAAKFLGPEVLGKINSLNLILTYTTFLHLGVFNGLNRNLSIYLAQNNINKVQNMFDASFFVAKINSFLCLIIGAFTIIYFSINFDIVLFLTSITITVTLILTPYILLLDTTFRSSQSFGIMGIIIIKENFVLLITSFFPAIIGYVGKLISNLLRDLLKIYLRLKHKIYWKNSKANFQEIFELIKVGFPLLINSYLYNIFVITDQSIIVKFLGTKNLGLYSLSTIIMSVFNLIPVSLARILYPKAGAIYGKEKNNLALRKFFYKSLLVNLFLILPLVLITYFLIEPLTIIFLPKYTDGILAAKINLLTCLTYIAYGPSIILAITKRSHIISFFYIIGIITMWFLSFFNYNKLNLENISLLRFIVKFIINLIIILFSYYVTTIKEFRI
jgi:O-antigen/teichoic acid export membrane protein